MGRNGEGKEDWVGCNKGRNENDRKRGKIEKRD